jgi:hypothetical protein
MRLLLPLIAAIPVFLAACGGGDETEVPLTGASASPTAVASMTAEEHSAVEAFLKAAALQAEDLPSGLTLADEKFTTNEDEAEQENILPGAPTAEDLSRWGRILGYQASYSPEAPSTATGATVFFQLETNVYQDSKGADKHFEAIRQQPSDPGFINAFQEEAKAAGGDVRDASISPMAFAKVGDDRMAFEMRIRAHYTDPDRELNLVTQDVGIRRGRAIGFITVVTLDSPSPVQELEDLTRTLDERLKDALE